MPEEMEISKDNSETKKEVKELDIQEIKNETNSQLNNSLDMDKGKIIKQLKKAKNVEERVKLFAKWTDSYGLEAIAWFIPAIWDITPAIISTCYLLTEWINVWLSWKDCMKILWCQILDVFVWAVPIIWDIADFFLKWNRYSAKIFSEHLEKLKKAALEKWASQEEINNVWKNEARVIKTMNKYVDYKSKKKKKSKEKSDSKKEA